MIKELMALLNTPRQRREFPDVIIHIPKMMTVDEDGIHHGTKATVKILVTIGDENYAAIDSFEGKITEGYFKHYELRRVP